MRLSRLCSSRPTRPAIPPALTKLMHKEFDLKQLAEHEKGHVIPKIFIERVRRESEEILRRTVDGKRIATRVCKLF